MKTLSIVRHAKAKRPHKFPTDRERPLTKRGRRDARQIASRLARLEPPVDWIISSPAVRTRETVEPVLKTIEYADPVIWEESVYHAQADTLLDVLRHAPDRVEHVVLVGHNPSMAELVAGLSAGSPQRLHLHMPPATLAHLRLEIFQWKQIRWGCGQLRVFLPPKLLRDES